jgi:hypothetical protein
MNGEARLEQQWEPQFVRRAPLASAGRCEGEPAISFSGHAEDPDMPPKGDFSILGP